MLIMHISLHGPNQVSKYFAILLYKQALPLCIPVLQTISSYAFVVNRLSSKGCIYTRYKAFKIKWGKFGELFGFFIHCRKFILCRTKLQTFYTTNKKLIPYFIIIQNINEDQLLFIASRLTLQISIFKTKIKLRTLENLSKEFEISLLAFFSAKLHQLFVRYCNFCNFWILEILKHSAQNLIPVSFP